MDKKAISNLVEIALSLPRDKQNILLGYALRMGDEKKVKANDN